MRTEREGLAGQGTRQLSMAWACPRPTGRPRFTCTPTLRPVRTRGHEFTVTDREKQQTRAGLVTVALPCGPHQTHARTRSSARRQGEIRLGIMTCCSRRRLEPGASVRVTSTTTRSALSGPGPSAARAPASSTCSSVESAWPLRFAAGYRQGKPRHQEGAPGVPAAPYHALPRR